MGKKLHVGNLSGNVNESDLETMFSGFGTAQSTQVVSDRDTGGSREFDFVEMDTDRDTGGSKEFDFVAMDTDAQAQAAIRGLHDHERDGRRLTVYEAMPGDDRGDGSGRSDDGGY